MLYPQIANVLVRSPLVRLRLFLFLVLVLLFGLGGCSTVVFVVVGLSGGGSDGSIGGCVDVDD